MPAGSFISRAASLIFCTASPRETRGARLKEIVVAGNCPCRVNDSGADIVSRCVNALNGTAPAGVEVDRGVTFTAEVEVMFTGGAPPAVDGILVTFVPGLPGAGRM